MSVQQQADIEKGRSQVLSLERSLATPLLRCILFFGIELRQPNFALEFMCLQGPILGFIYAVKELLEEGKASEGSLPVNVAFVFEGEEENGSVGFEEAIQGNLHWFEGTQLIVISNTLWVGERVPCLTYGLPLTYPP